MPMEHIQVTLVEASAGNKQAQLFEINIPINPYFPPVPPFEFDKVKVGEPIVDLNWEMDSVIVPLNATSAPNGSKVKVTGTIDVPISIWYRDQANTVHYLADILTFEISLACKCCNKPKLRMETMARSELIMKRFIDDYSKIQICLGINLLMQFLNRGCLVIPSMGFCPIPPDCECPVLKR